jgi:hypothetical protein
MNPDPENPCPTLHCSPVTPTPSTEFSNDPVVFVGNCPAGQVTVFTGVLPGWITLVGNTFTGAAGYFRGDTKADATATAQAALDSFVNTAFGLGQIYCSDFSCGGVPSNPSLLSWAIDTSGQETMTGTVSGSGASVAFNLSVPTANRNLGGQITATAQICNPGASPLNVLATITGLVFNVPVAYDDLTLLDILAVTPAYVPMFVRFPNLSTVTGPVPYTFVIPPNSVGTIQFEFTVHGSGPVSMSGTIQITI